MGAEKGIAIAVGLLVTVMIAVIVFNIWKQGSGMANKGLSQAAQLSAKFNDIDKQKYDGMTLTGDSVQQVIQDYWDDTTCEVVVCTLDGVNAVYNKESTDGTYTVPFSETISGMPTADCKGRAFPSDTAINDLSALTASSYSNQDVAGGTTYDVATVAALNFADGAATGNAIIVDAARLVQNPGGTNTILATPNGCNTTTSVGSGGYISASSNFIGSIQKDSNGTIRRITFVQES